MADEQTGQHWLIQVGNNEYMRGKGSRDGTPYKAVRIFTGEPVADTFLRQFASLHPPRKQEELRKVVPVSDLEMLNIAKGLIANGIEEYVLDETREEWHDPDVNLHLLNRLIGKITERIDPGAHS
jgi:hypothetical protein